MSAYGCCGEYNEHAPDCVVIRMQKVQMAWRAILKWVRVDTLPKDHPLRQMQRALRKQKRVRADAEQTSELKK